MNQLPSRNLALELVRVTETAAIAASGWVGHGDKNAADGAAVDAAGNVYFSDAANDRIHKIDHASGKASVFVAKAGGATDLAFAPGGRLYACLSGKRQIVAYNGDGKASVVADGVSAKHLAVTAKGEVYFTDPQTNRVWFVNSRNEKRVVHEGIRQPAGVKLSPDHSLLLVASAMTRWVWSFQIQPDGSLAHGLAFHRLEIEDEVEPGETRSGAAGLTVDTESFVYVATRLGLQISDPAGRTSAVLLHPQGKPVTSVAFGGPALDTLYVTAGDQVFRRPMKRKGVFSWTASKPPAPRL